MKHRRYNTYDIMLPTFCGLEKTRCYNVVSNTYAAYLIVKTSKTNKTPFNYDQPTV